MKPVVRRIADSFEGMQGLDPVADPLQKAVGQALPPGPLKDLLSGTWLGHPLHPLLTDVVVGSWLSAFLLDWLGGEDAQQASDRLIGLGILAAVPTAASGLSDWAELWGKQRRLGLVHAGGNASAVALFGLSWIARKSDHRLTGKLLSTLGFGVASLSAFLGGHLSFGKGVGVNNTAFEAWPSEWTSVMSDKDLEAGKPSLGKAGDVGVLLVRKGRSVYALSDTCSHRGWGLHDGELDAEQLTIQCPCHGSVFNLEDGDVIRGPATSPQPAYEARVRSGKVEVRLPQE